MPVHPAPPTDLSEFVEAYEHAIRSVIDLGVGCSERDADKPTDCPGWTVRDQFSHIAAVERMLAGDPLPPPIDPAAYPHVHGEMGAFTERGVAVRRETPLAEIVAEIGDVLERRMEQLHDPAITADSEVQWLDDGRISLLDMLGRRLVDIWVHDQDIRTALGRPGNLGAPGAAIFETAILDALPRVVARAAHVPTGDSVILDVTGPVVARGGARVAEGDDGRPHGDTLFTGAETGSIPVIGSPAAEAALAGTTTTITLSTDALTRRAAGRRGVEQTPHTVNGDEATAARVLEALRIIDF